MTWNYRNKKAIPQAGGTPGTAKPLLLVVDDEPMIRTLTRRVLSTDFEVVEAKDGVEARALVAVTDFAVILCDNATRNGLSFLRELCGARPELVRRVVLLASTAIAGLLPELNPIPVLEKPFDASRLRRSVHQTLGNRRDGCH